MTAPPDTGCDPLWDLDDAVYVDGPDRDLLGQQARAYDIANATVIQPVAEYL